MKQQNIIKHIVLYALFAWGFFSFLILAGDENPQEPLPLSMFFSLKLGALISLILCVYTGKFLRRKGYLPDSFVKEMEDEEL